MFSRESTDVSSDKSAVHQARINILEFSNSFHSSHHYNGHAESVSVCEAFRTQSTAAVTDNDACCCELPLLLMNKIPFSLIPHINAI